MNEPRYRRMGPRKCEVMEGSDQHAHPRIHAQSGLSLWYLHEAFIDLWLFLEKWVKACPRVSECKLITVVMLRSCPKTHILLARLNKVIKTFRLHWFRGHSSALAPDSFVGSVYPDIFYHNQVSLWQFCQLSSDGLFHLPRIVAMYRHLGFVWKSIWQLKVKTYS